jgi:hypothetical protein
MIKRRRFFPAPTRAPAAALLAALALAACGGAAPAPAYPEEPLPASPEGTLDLLDRAEGELRLALGEPANQTRGEPAQAGAPPLVNQPSTPPASEAPPPPPAAPPPHPTRAPIEASPSAGAESVQTTDASPSGTVTRNDPCANACRALASMERATEHLCSLAGSADARCEGARARVKGAGARVREKCPGCAS